MTRMATEYERADHDRDERKHEWRPGDVVQPGDAIPLHVEPKPLSTALEIALLVKALPRITDAAALIEQYGDTRASEGRLDGATDAYARIDKVLSEGSHV